MKKKKNYVIARQKKLKLNDFDKSTIQKKLKLKIYIL